MSARSELNAFIRRVQARLRLGALIRGAAILTSVALAVTVVLVFVSNLFAFSAGSLTGARILLLIALAFALGFGIALPLYGLDRRRAVGKAEVVFPKFQQRLVTFTERESNDPFIELLASDTLTIAKQAEPKRLFSDSKLLAAVGTGLASLAVLLWMIVAGPGYLGHGASLLWLGAAHSGAPLYDLRVTPGDVTVRRNADQIVTAQIVGLQASQVRLFARYQSASKWDEVAMQAQPGGSGFQFLFAGLPEGVEYYVEAGPLHSRHFNIRVADLPSVKQIRVTYHFPGWTGLPKAVEERSGDLRAVEGTEADLEVFTDRPLKDGILMFDDNHELHLSSAQGNVYTGAVKIEKDGLYHVAMKDQGESVRLSDDYFIEANKANPPDVRIERPPRDYRASPIEEVTVGINAADEFGLQDMKLHYSVNGGDEKTVDLLKQKGGKEADGSTVLSLEDYKLVPGDLVSVYATAKDAHAESRSDIYFIQVDPFEREFSQSQQAGGGGGGGMGGGANGQQDTSEREKEIIAATWKQLGDKTSTPAQNFEQAKFLSDVQGKLRDQALSLAGRLERRELNEENQEFSEFQQDMDSAAQAMAPASDKLGQQKWKDAMPQEQKALQFLLRAEATFRRIEVAFGNRGGGGGGGSSAGRDLASLFDLELDTEKNQYETAQTNQSQSQQAQDIDEALKKLDELARRQQDLASQQQNAQDYQQRYQQEILRREAEELQRQIEQMSRNGQSGSSGTSGQSGQGSAQGSAQGSQQKQPNSSDPRVQQALDQLRQANEAMQRAASQGQQGQQDQADARRAADRLRQAAQALEGMQNQQGSGQLDSMVREGDRLEAEQKNQDGRLQQAFGRQGQGGSPNQGSSSNQGNSASGDQAGKAQQLNQLAGDRDKLGQDLSSLERQMQDTVRQLAEGQKPAASKLRDALSGAQQSDLSSRIQRSADWIRRGIDPNSNSGEQSIASDLGKLDDQLRQAQQALGGNGQPQGTEQALDRVDRLREQMEALSRGLDDRAARNGQSSQGQPGQGQPGQGQQGQGGQPGQNGQPGQGAQGGQNANGGGRNGGFAGRGGPLQGGEYGARAPGVYGGFDPGGYDTPGGSERQPVPVSQADMDRAYDAAVQELNDLRASVQDQPQPLNDIRDLMRQLQQLDPKRFPGNPAMLDQLHTQVLASVDKLELQLRRDLDKDNQNTGQVRSGDSLTVPSGYEDAVAEYFRRLSNKNP